MMSAPTFLDDGSIDYFVHRLAADPEGVARLSRVERERRVTLLIEESNMILDYAIETMIISQQKKLAGIVGLFSGGNDSTVLCHVMLQRITHLAHANTTIGVEQTRQFVRDTAQDWCKPLLEFKPANESDHYRALVLDHGFPGPGHHFKMYQRLKERSLRQVRAALVQNRSQRVVFLAGRRRTESKRRAAIPMMERTGSIVWASPMVNWTKMDLNTYRLMHEVPVNEVTELLHMSGECLCGSFAHAGELDEISIWFPDVANEIRALQSEIAHRDDIPEQRKTWGWGSNSKVKASKTGALCTSCDARWQDTNTQQISEHQSSDCTTQPLKETDTLQ
jgi:3'-phosphoadenosine 5'-phosphosulfate sulfotransferase (PAPS reductase)/FAD synthetase